MTPATKQKRKALTNFIERELLSESAVQAVICIGSVANGLARPDSDIDAVVFFDPLDYYIVPAESKWCPDDGSHHSIMASPSDDYLQLDFKRLNLAAWSDPSFEWPEALCAELADGWIAFDRFGKIVELIEARTGYSDAVRNAKLDQALVMLDQHLSDGGAESRWENLGAVIAQDRLQAAYEHLVQALFAYNRRWRPWRDREMSFLLSLPWLPQDFEDRILGALNGSSLDYGGYSVRTEHLRGLFEDVKRQLLVDGDYEENVVFEAFERKNEEPGRAWNMDVWNEKHAQRKV